MGEERQGDLGKDNGKGVSEVGKQERETAGGKQERRNPAHVHERGEQGEQAGTIETNEDSTKEREWRNPAYVYERASGEALRLHSLNLAVHLLRVGGRRAALRVPHHRLAQHLRQAHRRGGEKMVWDPPDTRTR